MTNMLLTYHRPLLTTAPWLSAAGAETWAAPRLWLMSAAVRLLRVGGGVWFVLWSLLAGAAMVCVAGAMCGGIALLLIVRGAWAACSACGAAMTALEV